AFVTALDEQARARFADTSRLASILASLYDAASAAHPELTIERATFAAELARRLGAAADLDQLERVCAQDVYLAIACAAGDAIAISQLDAVLGDEIEATGLRLRASADQIDEVGADIRRVL